jgi:hypothetical protein
MERPESNPTERFESQKHHAPERREFLSDQELSDCCNKMEDHADKGNWKDGLREVKALWERISRKK